MTVKGASFALPAIVPASALGLGGFRSPSERLTMGVIGIGAMGIGHVAHCLGDPGQQLLAVCDVDLVRREGARQRADEAYAAARGSAGYKACTAYNDYREVLARPDIDAVIIASPDHWHALQSVDAAKAGKDVYCEKPISLTIAEGRRVVEVMRAYGRVFQTGTQYRSSPTTRRICEFVRRGGIGKVKQVFTVWTLTEGSYTPVSRPVPPDPVPEGLDWELWVGPAPWRPYSRHFHRNPVPGVVPWAFCEDFGAASITWHHSHSADVIHYAIGMERSGPVEILPPGAGPYPTLTYRYANGILSHLVDDWSQVINLYKAVPPHAKLGGLFGGLFVGEKGWVTTMYGAGPPQGEPESIFQEMGMPTRQLSGANNHHANWHECIRTRAAPSSDEEIGHRSASLGHLAHIAFKVGRRLVWDPVKEVFANDEAANRLRSRAMREPWRL